RHQHFPRTWSIVSVLPRSHGPSIDCLLVSQFPWDRGINQTGKEDACDSSLPWFLEPSEPWSINYLDHRGPCQIDRLETLIPPLPVSLDSWAPRIIVASTTKLRQGPRGQVTQVPERPSHPGS